MRQATRPPPPPVTRWLLRRLLPGTVREFLVGDLDEEYRRYALARWSRSRANHWYRSQAARTVIHSLRHRRQHRASGEGRGSLFTALGHDMRHAIRSLRHTPGFAALVTITLSLGIGATTAIFSAVNHVILRPLSFAEPDRLVMLWERNDERGWDWAHAAPANVEDWSERVGAFSAVAYLSDYTTGLAVTGHGEPFMVQAANVSGGLFDVLGVPALLGRTFREGENTADAAPVVVLAHRAWTGYFGSDRAVIGKTIQLDGVSHEVIGVMGPDFRYAFTDADLWLPFRWTHARRESIWFRQAHVVRAVARLREGGTIERARRELAAAARELQSEYPETNAGMEAGLTQLQSFLLGDRRLPLLLLLGAAGLLQLVACANVANLLLVRAVARRRETAVRAALGAGRVRVVLQALTESLTVGLIGGLLGVGLGFVGLQWIAAFRPVDLPVWEIHLDWRFLGFATLATVTSVVLFGIAPALRHAIAHPAGALQEGGRGVPTKGVSRFASALAAAEIGIALILVTGAGLMIRSLVELERVDSGVNAENVLTFEITPPSGRYPTGRARAAFLLELESRLRTLPGVLEAGVVRHLPFTGGGWTSDFSIDGWPVDRFGIEVKHREASPGYFRVMGIQLLEGELFRRQLAPNEVVPVLVNRAFAQRYFPNGGVVGRRIAFDRAPDETAYWYRIVGVVGNERHDAMREPQPEIIAHLLGDTPRTARFALKTQADPLSLVPAVRQAAREIDDAIPLVSFRTMNQVAAHALERDRFLMTLLGVFAAVALLLACIGIYGVTAHAARSRVREIGIRMALGASHRRITRDLVRRGVALVAAGLGVGIAGAIAVTRVMGGVLYEIEPTDPLTYTSVTVLLGGVAFLASYLPARRAAGLDPMTVLRRE